MAVERILIIDDYPGHLSMLGILFERKGFQVYEAGSGESGMKLLGRQPVDVVLTDLTMPGMDGVEVLRRVKASAARDGRDIPVVVVTGSERHEDSVRALREGADAYIKKPFVEEELYLAVRRAIETAAIRADRDRLAVEVSHRFQLGEMVGRSEAMVKVYEQVRPLQSTRITVLVLGESGTGKEMLARSIHAGSDRRGAKFVPVNCGAIPEHLVESSFFGYKKGAFTGADRDRDGYFAAADRGTLFLDEIGELSLAGQVKLLRVLQERRFTPVGATEEVPVDVRLIAATNRDLEAMVKAGQFREDLYYRIANVPITMPPLRQRPSDIPELVRHFVAKKAEDFGKPVAGVTNSAMALLERHDWPGNVRELEGVIERAVALERGPEVTPEALPDRIRDLPQRAPNVALAEGDPTSVVELFRAPGFNLDETIARYEREHIERALREADGNRTRAAKLLGITFRSLRYRLARMGVADDGEGE